MNRLNKVLATAFLSAVLLFTGAAQAMEIIKFDKIAEADQNEYVGELVAGTEKLLNDEGRLDLVAKMHTFFGTIDPGSQIPLGVGEFEENLALARVADAQRAAEDPTARRLEVEDAMAITLRKNGIEVPDSFFTVMKDFKPQHSQDETK